VRQRLPFWAAVALAVVGALAAVVLLVRDERSSPVGRPVGADGFAAQASIVPRNQLFGEPVRARLELLVDRAVLDPDKVRVSPKFDPFTPTGAPRRTRRDFDRLTRIRLDFPLECLATRCVPETLTQDFDLSAAVVRYAGQPVGVVEWPRVTIGSRVGDFAQAQASGRGPAQQQNVDLPWRATLRLRPVTFAANPTLLTTLLAALALALLVASLYFVQVAFPTAPLGFRRLRRVKLTPLERALAVLERAHDQGIEREQRLALDRLAHELRTGGEPELAGTARELAWEQSVPDAGRTASFSARVRDLIAGRTNGSS